MSGVWNATEAAAARYTITICSRGTSRSENFDAPIKADQVKAAARGVGLSQFTVYNTDNVMLEMNAFPYAGNIVIREYNAAKF